MSICDVNMNITLTCQPLVEYGYGIGTQPQSREGEMRVLILGAGGIGGYFGGRLAQAGADVTFLVRPARQARLREHGLVLRSCYGDYTAPVATLTQDALKAQPAPHWDVVILTSKAYDLDTAIDAIRPAVGPDTAVLPLLNGIAHMETLNNAFGKERVLGGIAKIVVALSGDGEIHHMNDWKSLRFGEQNGELSARVKALAAAFPAASVDAQAVPDIMQHMWQKIVHLSTVATATCLMRASVGNIVSVEGGSALLNGLLDKNAEIAGLEGYPIPESFLADYRTLFADPTSPYIPSILRDIERGNPIEGDHIVGFMLSKALRHGLDATVHALCWQHLQAYQVRRAQLQQA